MTNWKKIHEVVGEEWDGGKTYQQLWEEGGFISYQDAQEWVKLGFKPSIFN